MDESNNPNARRNRIGCFVILGVLLLFAALYVLASINAGAGNKVAQDIQTVPVAPR